MHDGLRRHIMGYHRACTEHCSMADVHAVENDDPKSDPHLIFDNNATARAQRLLSNRFVGSNAMIVRVERAVRSNGYAAANANRRLVRRKQAVRLDIGLLAYFQTAAGPCFNDDFAMQADAVPQFDRTGSSIDLINQDAITNKNMLAKAKLRMVQPRAWGNEAATM